MAHLRRPRGGHSSWDESLHAPLAHEDARYQTAGITVPGSRTNTRESSRVSFAKSRETRSLTLSEDESQAHESPVKTEFSFLVHPWHARCKGRNPPRAVSATATKTRVTTTTNIEERNLAMPKYVIERTIPNAGKWSA